MYWRRLLCLIEAGTTNPSIVMPVGGAKMKYDTNLCRICLKCLSTDIKHQMLKDLEENVLECLTEIDLTIPANPLACEECLASILSLYQFKQTCCATERLVQDLRTRSIPFEDALKYVDIHKVKSEEEHLEVVDYKDIDFNTEVPTVLQNNNAVASNTCFTCSSTFNSRRGLLLHLKSHKEKCTKNNSTLNDRLHKCDYCEYRSKTKHTLSVHLRKHTGEKPFACDLCEYKSARKDKYKTHRQTHSKEKLFYCNDCNFGTNYKATLAYHVTIHKDRRPFKCGQCTFSTVAKYLLNIHRQKKHGKIFKHMCDVCGYGTNKSTSLRAHLRTHTGEKPYKCTVCGYSTKQKSQLMTHMTTHTNKKNFKCVECDYAASTSVVLKYHMRKHTGDKTYKCDKCSYLTVHASSISRHRKRHLSSAVLKCNSCDFKTLSICHLLYHKC